VVKAVLRLRIAATSMPEYVFGWCGHGFETHSQPFLLTYPETDLSLWRLILYFQTWYGSFHLSREGLLAWRFRLGTEPRRVHWCLLCLVTWHVAFVFTLWSSTTENSLKNNTTSLWFPITMLYPKNDSLRCYN